MKVFLAGATGAIGHPLVTKLLQEGHEVFAMSRSHEKALELAKIGVQLVLADAMNETSVLQGIENARPEVVIEMLTSLPKIYTPQAMRDASETDTKLRLIGGGFLQKAAERVGAKRYILQSSAFWYGPGRGLATEEDTFAFDASPGIAAGCRVYEEIERRVLQSSCLEGVSLRFGFFYGPGTWFSRDGDMARQVKEREFPIVGSGDGHWNFVHIDDAASGIVSAMRGPPGIYNITGDVPVKMSEWVPAFAQWLGAPSPLTRSEQEEEALNGKDRVYYATALRGASNEKARRLLGFTPRPLEWLEAAGGSGPSS